MFGVNFAPSLRAATPTQNTSCHVTTLHTRHNTVRLRHQARHALSVAAQFHHFQVQPPHFGAVEQHRKASVDECAFAAAGGARKDRVRRGGQIYPQRPARALAQRQGEAIGGAPISASLHAPGFSWTRSGGTVSHTPGACRREARQLRAKSTAPAPSGAPRHSERRTIALSM